MKTDTTIRLSAGIVGAGIINAVTFAGVVAAGGLAEPQAPLLIALAAGLVVGAMACGQAWHGGRRTLALAMLTTLLTGECYALLSIGERELEAREARQAPKAADADRRAALTAAIAKGEAALAALTSPRLENALSVARDIGRQAIDAAALPGCRKGCIETLERGKAGAQRELEAARAELEGRRQVLEAAVSADRRALAAIPTVSALSPLAARVGVADWLLDLIRAGLFSVSANGLGAFLLAFAAHPGRWPQLSAPGDTSQTSFAWPQPEPPPRGPGKRRKRSQLPASVALRQLPANVVPIAGKRSDIVAALEAAGRPMTVSELARRMGVTRGEASRRWREAGELVDARRDGKFVVVSLRRARAA